MKQISKSKYEVNLGDRVDIELIPIGIDPNFILAALDGHAISPFTQYPYPRYSFEIQSPSHLLFLEAFFDGAPPSAEVNVEISGSDGTKFSGPTIDKNNPDVAIEFGTRTGGPR